MQEMELGYGHGQAPGEVAKRRSKTCGIPSTGRWGCHFVYLGHWHGQAAAGQDIGSFSDTKHGQIFGDPFVYNAGPDEDAIQYCRVRVHILHTDTSYIQKNIMIVLDHNSYYSLFQDCRKLYGVWRSLAPGLRNITLQATLPAEEYPVCRHQHPGLLQSA